MITFMLGNGVVATLRTSGTEPKIKYYTELCAAPGKRSEHTPAAQLCVFVNEMTSPSSCCCSDVSCLEAELRKVTAALLEEFLEPERNNLIRRVV